jgi:hypothetical protein
MSNAVVRALRVYEHGQSVIVTVLMAICCCVYTLTTLLLSTGEPDGSAYQISREQYCKFLDDVLHITVGMPLFQEVSASGVTYSVETMFTYQRYCLLLYTR